MIRKLASIKLTFSCIVSLGFLLMVGVFFFNNPDYRIIIEGLNGMLLFDWLEHHLWTHGMISTWVLLICLTALLLMINTVCCTFSTLLPMAFKRPNIKRWSFFGIHILFLVVLSCHGVALICGHKAEDITLFPGESHALIDDLTLQLMETTYVDDIDILTKGKRESRKLMTRKRFHHNENNAFVSLVKGEEKVASKKVRFLDPLVHGTLRVTVTRFLLEKSGKKEMTIKNHLKKINREGERSGKTQAVGAVFTVTRNPFTSIFFTAYGLLILAIVGFIWATQKE